MHDHKSYRPTDPRITVVIPAMNEARNLEVILPELPPVHEVILVDGRSVDDTVATARRLMPSIRTITQSRRGKGNALACGFAAATGDIIVMFDADGSADAAEIERFVAALRNGADFAKGSRFADGGGSHDLTRWRSTGNWALNKLANVMLRTRYTDLCYGYNAFWTDILRAPRPAEPPHLRPAGQAHGVGRRIRDRDRADLPDRGRPPAGATRSAAWSGCACTVRATSTRCATGCGC